MSRRGALAVVPLSLALAAAPALAGGHHARPKTQKVTVGDDYYSKSRLTVHVGDRVRWTWSENNFEQHNVTLSAAPRHVKHVASKSMSSGYRFTFRFTRPGRYSFHCTYHPLAMHLDVKVRAARRKRG